MDYKGKVLKLKEEKKSWEVESSGLIPHISILNTNQREEEEVLEELMNQPLIQNEDQMNDSPAKEMSVTLSHINLIQGGIKELKEENHMIKQEMAQNIEEKNTILNERKQLQKKVSELKEKVAGKIPLQGANHIIWDALSVEFTKFRRII